MGDRRTPERIDAELRRRRSALGGLGFRTVLQVGLILALLVLCVLLVDVVRDGWSVLSTRLGDFLSGTLPSSSVDEQLGVHQGLVG